MARIRTIKPEFFQHDGLAELSMAHRLLFIGLWTLADREGRLDDRTARIKAAVFPYDTKLDVDRLLDGLFQHQERFIVRYEIDGERFIQISNFTEHQKPHVNEIPSKIPPLQVSTTKEVPACDQGSLQEAQEGKGREQEGKGTHTVRLAPHASTPEGFEEFWIAYPRKLNKRDAVIAFRRQGIAEVAPLVAAVEAWKRSEQWSRDAGKYIPNPATWLNGRRWENEHPETNGIKPGALGTHTKSARDDPEWQELQRVLRAGREER